MIDILDYIFLFVITFSICYYYYMGNTKEMQTNEKIIDNIDNINSTKIEKNINKTNISEYESDKYKDKNENLPWDDDNINDNIDGNNNNIFMDIMDINAACNYIKPKMTLL
jgi:hypothetical protein